MRRKRISVLMAVTVLGTQMSEAGAVYAEGSGAEYGGTTSVAESEQYFALGDTDVELIVEEIYIESGSYVEEGGQILKLTEESYQEALDYYEAAIVYAENELTNAQMDYEKGMEEAEYTRAIAEAEAEQAEFVREQQEAELEDTLAEHEEALAELEEYIAEIEEGIEAGSYTSSSSGSTSGGSVSGGFSAGGSTGSGETEAFGTNGESEEDEEETEPDSEAIETPDSETEKPDSNAETPDSETEKPDSNAEMPDNDNGVSDKTDAEQMEETLTGLAEQIEALEVSASERKAAQEEANERLQKKNEEYNEQLKEIYEQLGLDISDICGTGEVDLGTQEALAVLIENAVSMSTYAGENDSEESEGETGSTESETGTAEGETDTMESETGTAEGETDTMEGETGTAEGETDTMESETGTAGGETDTTESETGSTESETDVTESESDAGKNEDDVTEGETAESESTDAGSGDNTAEILEAQVAALEAENSRLAALLAESEASEQELLRIQEELNTRIGELTASLEASQSVLDSLSEMLEVLHGMEAERTTLYDALNEATGALDEVQTELTQLKEQRQELSDALLKYYRDALEESSENSQGETEQTNPGEDSQNETDSSANGLEQFLPETDEDGAGSFFGDGTDSKGEESGNVQGITGSVSLGNAGFSSGGTGTNVSGGTFSSGAGTENSGAAMAVGGGMQGAASSSDISLFGDTYDLSSIQALLEREPSDEEDAEALLEELEEGLETVQKQYAELNRNKKATELEIQYTYDTAVIAGKLAELTYQQETEELDADLREAEDAVEEQKEQQAVLTSMTDGILTAQAGGTIASVSYEAGDTLSAASVVYTLYETDAVTVTIEVEQYEIAGFSVGEEVEVELTGYGSRTGTISQKSMEASETSTRTAIYYEVVVSLDNENGRLSAGTGAVVTAPSQEEEETEV